MKYWLFIPLFYSVDVFGQNEYHKNPEDAQLVTTDIENFWNAFELAKGKTEAEKLTIFNKEYIDKASDGLTSYIQKRDKKTEKLIDGVYSMVPFYESIKEDMLNISAYEKEMKASSYALKYLYPQAVFPDTYFFVWFIFDSGSTTSDKGLLMTTEAHSVSKETPMGMFPEVQHEVLKAMNMQNLSLTVAHELIHFQQPDIKTNSLLEKAVREGTADFIAELICGRNPSAATHAYANPREEELWKEFKAKMYEKDLSGWTGIPNDRPAGLAYWMGYKIVESYYDKQLDKVEAVKRIIEAKDYENLYKQSGYETKFK